MFKDTLTQSIAEAAKKCMGEELKGYQHKIDANKNGKIDAEDFKKLRNEDMQKADVPAYLRKQKGEKPLSVADVKGPRPDSISSKEALAKARNEESKFKTNPVPKNKPAYTVKAFEEVELDEAKVTTPDENPNRVTTDEIKGREEGGKSNSFKAFKLKLKTDSQGHPQVANPNGLFEQLMMEFKEANEAINAPINKTKDSEQYYKFIMAKAKLGRPLTRQEQEFVRTYKMFGQQQVAEKKLFALTEIGEAKKVRAVMTATADLMKKHGFRAYMGSRAD